VTGKKERMRGMKRERATEVFQYLRKRSKLSSIDMAVRARGGTIGYLDLDAELALLAEDEQQQTERNEIENYRVESHLSRNLLTSRQLNTRFRGT
jgi:hypothetical protein